MNQLINTQMRIIIFHFFNYPQDRCTHMPEKPQMLGSHCSCQWIVTFSCRRDFHWNNMTSVPFVADGDNSSLLHSTLRSIQQQGAEPDSQHPFAARVRERGQLPSAACPKEENTDPLLYRWLLCFIDACSRFSTLQEAAVAVRVCVDAFRPAGAFRGVVPGGSLSWRWEEETHCRLSRCHPSEDYGKTVLLLFWSLEKF